MAKDYKRLAKQLEDRPWLLYGACGFTGRLIIEECLRLGMRPTLAGRSIAPLRALAAEYDLPWRMLELENTTLLHQGLENFALVCNVAGPYTQTAKPLIDACLQTHTHYLDFSGELPSIRYAYEQHELALEKDVVLLPACGVESVPTDCLVSYLVEQFQREGLPDIRSVEVGVDTLRKKSPGSLLSIIEMSNSPGEVRRDGEIKREALGARAKKVRFTHGSKSLVSLPLADLEVLYRHFEIPDITTYAAQPALQSKVLQWASPFGQALMSNQGMKKNLQNYVKTRVRKPSARRLKNSRTYIWVRVKDSLGNEKQAWLETLDGYALIACIAPRSVCDILATRQQGVYTPAQLLGTEFVLDIPETVRFSSLKTEDDLAVANVQEVLEG